MKKICCTILLLTLFSLSGVTMAQGLEFGVGAGLSVLSNGNSMYNYNAGYHVGAKLKLDIPLVPITPVAFVNYHFLSGSTAAVSLATGQNVDFNQKILSAGFGVEYALLPGPIKPYIAVDFGYNNFGDSPSLAAYSRTGLDVGAGAEIKIPFLFTLDASIKYNMLNLFGKTSNEDNLTAMILNVSILL